MSELQKDTVSDCNCCLVLSSQSIWQTEVNGVVVVVSLSSPSSSSVDVGVRRSRVNDYTDAADAAAAAVTARNQLVLLMF